MSQSYSEYMREKKKKQKSYSEFIKENGYSKEKAPKESGNFKKSTSPSVKSSGSGASSAVNKTAQNTQKTTGSRAGITSESNTGNVRTSKTVNMKADAENRAKQDALANMSDAERQQAFLSDVNAANKISTPAKATLEQAQKKSDDNWEKEKVSYQQSQSTPQRTSADVEKEIDEIYNEVNTKPKENPSARNINRYEQLANPQKSPADRISELEAEKEDLARKEQLAAMSDSELKAERTRIEKERAEHKEKYGGRAKQLASYTAAVAKDDFSGQPEKRLGDYNNELGYVQNEEIKRDDYYNKFHSMSNEERALVAQINAFDEGYDRDGGKRLSAAAELKNKYNYTNDDIVAMTYFYNRYANKQRARDDEINARVAAEKSPFWSSAVSVPMNIAGGIGSAFGIADSYIDNKKAQKLGIADMGIDYNHPANRMQREAQAYRSEFTDNHDLMIGGYDVGDMLYNTTMSGLDSAAASVLPGWGGALVLGINAATSTTNELAQRGLSSEKAIVGGIAAGAFETIFEKVSIGNLKALKEVDAKTVGDVVKNIAKSMGVNATEEAATEAANIIYDTLAHGDLSNYQIEVKKLIESGVDEKTAQMTVAKGLALQVVESAASGALMGFGFGGASTVPGYIANNAAAKSAGREINQSGRKAGVLEAAKAMPTDTRAYKLSQKVKPDASGNISDKQIGKIAQAEADYIAEQKKPDSGYFKGTQSAAELGETYKRVKSGIEGQTSITENARKQKLKELERQYTEAKMAFRGVGTANAVKRTAQKDSSYFAHREQRQIDEIKRMEVKHPELIIGDRTVNVAEIIDIEDGDIKVKTTGGEEISISQIKARFADADVKRLYDEAAKMNKDTAKVFLESYDGDDVAEYKRAFEYYYNMGKAGTAVSTIRANDGVFGAILTADAQQRIAEAGLMDKEFKSGLTDWSVKKKSNLYKFEKGVLQAIGEKFGTEFIILDESSDLNAKYLTGTNRIVVYRNADGGVMLRSAAHETYHFVENYSSKDAADLRDYVLDTLKENGVDIEKALKKYAEQGPYDTREKQISELVADSMFDVFSNEDFIKNLTAKNQTLAKRLANHIGELVQKIREAVKMLSVRYSNPEIKALMNDAEKLDTIRNMLLEGYKNAGENFKAEQAKGQKNNAEGTAVKYSIHSDSQGDYVKVDVDQNIFVNKNVREMQSIARKIINQKYKGKVLNVGVKGKAFVNKRSADEYAYPANRRMDEVIKEAKMRSSTELDNLLAISKFINNEPDDGRHPDATGGWDIYETRFEVANIMFAGEIKIKVTDRGFVFYDITQIRRLPVNGNQTKINSAVASGNLPNNSIPKTIKSVKQNLSESDTEYIDKLKSERSELAEEYREIRSQIDEMKSSAEYKAFDDEVRTIRKDGSRFGGFEAVKQVRQKQKEWAESAGLSALEERFYNISEQLHDYDLEIYKLDKAQKERVTAELTDKVKKFSHSEVTEYVVRAAQKFGITKKFDNAGYMLTNGNLLDFSDGQGYRVLDHREIRDVLDFLPDNGNRSDGLIQFMNMGNIRMQIGGIDISKAPNKQQIPVLREFFNKNNGEITVDFSKENGDNAGSIEYPIGTKSEKILNDIKAYFENGTLPQISSAAAFHSIYSRKQSDPIQAHYAEVMRENRNLKNIISALDDMQYSSARSNIHLNGRDIHNIAGRLLRTASSKYELKTFEDELTAVYDYMANGREVDTEAVFESILGIANRVLEKSEMKDTELYEQYKDVREYLKSQPIYITPNVKAEIISQFGDYKSFRNLLMGKVNRISTTNTEARTLDEVWKELHEKAPEYFPEDVNEHDMPMHLTMFFESVAPKIVNPYEHYQADIEEAAALLATDIYEKYFEVGRLKTEKEKYRDMMSENLKKLNASMQAMRNEFRRKTAENEQMSFERYKTRVAEYRQRREDGDRRRVLRNQLERNYNYLNRRLMRETDNDHIPENLKPLISAFRSIVPDSNSNFSKSKFAEFENEYRKLENSSAFFDEDMADKIGELAKRVTSGLEAPKMRELNNAELQSLRDISEHMKYVVQNENRLFSDRLKGRIDSFAQEVHAEMESKPESKAQGTGPNAKLRDKLTTGVDSFIKGLTKPEYLFESLGSETLKTLYDEMRRGENTEARMLFDAKTVEQEIKKRNGYDNRWANNEVTIKLRSGDLTVTTEQAMALYATSKRNQGLEHMLKGGVIIYATKKDAKGRSQSKRERRVFTEQDIQTIKNALTANQINYVNEMVDYITNDIGSKRNEISMRLYGIEKYKEKFYFPIKVDKHFLDSSLGKKEVISTTKNQSSSKRTVNKAANPIEINGFTETVNNHIYDSALYCAYVLPMEDFKRVYNFRDKVIEGEGAESLIMKDISIKEDIRRTKGVNAIKEMEQFMVALDSGSRYENLMPLSAKLAARAKKTAVMANLSVVVQQPTAVFRAMLYISPKHFTTWASKADIAEMKKWNGCALKKEIGYFDVNMGRTATDFINEYTPDKSIKKDWSIKDRVSNGNIMMTIDQAAGWGATKADEKTWGAIWKACKKQTKEQNPELSGDALSREASELFQKTISKTQVYDSVFTKPEYMRRKEGFAMMATQFMSEPITSLNMLAESVVKAKEAKGSTQQKEARKFCNRAFACYVTSVVVNSALKSLIYTMRDDDEDKSFLEKYIANVTEGIATDPIGMFPYVKDIFSIVQGYDLNRTDVAVFASFKDAIDSLGSDKKTGFEKVMSVMKAAGQASGIPAYAVLRDAKAIVDIGNKIINGVQNGFEPTTGRGIINELKETFDYIPGVNPESKYDQLYRAIAEGDKKHYDKVYNNLVADGKDDSTINGELAKRLAENDGRIAAAYEATANDNTVEASRNISQLKDAGYSEEVINKALSRYKNNLTTAAKEDERSFKAAEARYNMDYDEYERIIGEMVSDGYSELIVKDAINSQKIELETKADEFSIDEKDRYTASYDLKNALLNGDSADVRMVHKKLSAEIGKDKADEEVRKYAKSAYKSGAIGETEAKRYLTEYKNADDDENDIFWIMEDLKGGDDYQKYDKLYDAIDNSRGLESTISYYTEHGVSITTVRSNITSEYKPKLTSLTPGTAEYREMYDNVIDAIVATGKTEAEARKQVNKWFK